MLKRSLAALLLIICWSCPISAASPDFPRLACYHGGSSGGSPFVKGDGTLDDVLIRQTARYPMVTVNPNAAAARPDFVARLRFWNPNIKILFYHQLTNWHLDSTFVVNGSDTSFYAEQHRAMQWAHGFVPGAAAYSGFIVDWKQADLADTLIRLYVKHTKKMRPDGWFFDYWNPTAGGAFGISGDDDANRVYNAKRLVTALRATLPGILVFGNGPDDDVVHTGLDGGMDEGFPNGLTMFAEAVGQPEGYWLKSESAVGTSGSPSVARYTLGVACLTGAYAEHGNSHYTGAPEQGSWWFPEYSVAPDGAPDPTGRYVGWLGQPTGPMTKLASAQWRRQFDHGCVVVNTGGSSATIQLGGTYRLIGSQSGITQTSVGPGTAVFLWKP
jgi:hypothetical protein